MSLVVDKLGVADGDTNGANANETRVDVTADGSLIVDLLVFLPKSESNSQLVQNEANFFLFSYFIYSSFVLSIGISSSNALYNDLAMLYL